jgi:FixJ family two-component response regulator
LRSEAEPHIVAVVEDDHLVRQSLAWTLSAAAYQVETFETARSCLAAIDNAVPTCVVVDLLLPGMTGMALCRELAVVSGCAFVVVSAYGDVSSAVEAMKLGATDFLEKPISQQRLIESVGRALDAASRQLREVREEEQAFERISTLSERERDVFEAMSQGLVTKQIATRLAISPRTVDVHRSHISRKLNLTSVSQLSHFLAVYYRGQARRDSA